MKRSIIILAALLTTPACDKPEAPKADTKSDVKADDKKAETKGDVKKADDKATEPESKTDAKKAQ